MGKKGKGKKGQRVVTDLDSFNNQELKKQQEKEFKDATAKTGTDQKSGSQSQQQ